VGAAAILGAWFFQYVLNMKPLSALPRTAAILIILRIPLAVMVLLGEQGGFVAQGAARGSGASLRSACSGMPASGSLPRLASSGNCGRAPTDCSGALDKFGSVTDLLKQIETMSPVRCDEAAWRFLGISLAGYNAIIALALAGCGGWGVRMGLRQPENP